ncbi:MAG: hypothetical protein ACLQVW_15610, partial [Limisphaerales bacterium]
PSCENIAPSTLHERVRRCWRDNRQPKNPRPKTSGIDRDGRRGGGLADRILPVLYDSYRSIQTWR